MHDKRFVAEHRGGPLKREEHYRLIEWACLCAGHVMHLLGPAPDDRLLNALRVARMWREGKASVGDARRASMGAIAVANELSDPTAVAVGRAVGHAVATAHMAGHSLGAALYALKAVRSAGGSVDAERTWQVEHLSAEIRELIVSTEKYRFIERFR